MPLMKVLVIGGTGFIGKPIVEALLQQGHDVTVLHRGIHKGIFPRAHHLIGNPQQLAEYIDAFRMIMPDVVIDLILSSYRQAAVLMQAFSGIARRVVAISSMDVYRACAVAYGMEPGPLEPVPLTEDSSLRTKPLYSVEILKKLRGTMEWVDDDYDKVPVERTIMNDAQLPGTVLRLPFVYGPGDPLHRLFPILKRVDDGRKVMLLDEGTAQWRGPRGYVENVAAAIVCAATSDRAAGRIYNVGDLTSFSELEWTRRVVQAAGWSGEIRIVPSSMSPAYLKLPGNGAQHWAADTSRIRNELGYSEPVPLEQALAATITWERAHPPAQIDPKQFDYAAEDACLAMQDPSAKSA